MATANFDVAAGLSQGAANKLLVEFYKTPPQTDNPFKNSLQTQLENYGTVTLTWSFDVQPTMLFGPPSQEDWNNALDSTGTTNQAANHALPTGPMIQLIAPSFTASYTLNSDTPVGGTAKNVQVYGTLSGTGGPSSNNITASMVAVLLDETGFKTWDSAIFNDVLIPIIFSETAKVLHPVQIPGISWGGMVLNSTWDICISGNTDSQLVTATTLTSNTSPLDISGVTWPTDPVFALASESILKSASAQVAQQLDNLSFGDQNQDFGGGLATWSFSCDVVNATVNPKTINPLTFDSSLNLKMSCGVSVSNKGLGVAMETCALSNWLAGDGGDNNDDPDFGSTSFNYDITYKPDPVGVSLGVSITKGPSVTFNGVDTNFDSFSLTPDTSGDDAIGDIGSTILSPVANLVAKKYQGSLKEKILTVAFAFGTINSIEIDKAYELTASNLALGDAQMPFGDTLKLTCDLTLAPKS